MAFETKITKARFVYSPFSAERMASIGTSLLDQAIIPRIKKAINANDAPAKPLKPGRNGRRGYPEQKVKRGGKPVRDWTLTGRTLRSAKVLSANENQAVLGLTDAKAIIIVRTNNMRERMWGVSPADNSALTGAVAAELKHTVRVEKAS